MSFAPSSFYKPFVCQVRSTDKRVVLSVSAIYWLFIPIRKNSTMNYTRNQLIINDSQISLFSNRRVAVAARVQEAFTLQTLSFSFTGKGYRLVQNARNTLAFSFGFSHIYYLYNPETLLYFRTKTRGYFLGLTNFILNKSITQLYIAKPINIYTGRGVRARKQVIRKKVGKVSLYM